MEVTLTHCEVYGLNGYKIGRLDTEGLIWSDRAIVMRVVEGRVYSMHEQYLGRFKNGIGKTDRGEVIFTAF